VSFPLIEKISPAGDGIVTVKGYVLLAASTKEDSMDTPTKSVSDPEGVSVISAEKVAPRLNLTWFEMLI
jgi:hypothetical protein